MSLKVSRNYLKVGKRAEIKERKKTKNLGQKKNEH
jgi:hypothetical protein